MRTPTPLAVALVALLAIASLPACDKARQVPGTTGTASGCTGCHGDQANAAPPLDTAGASAGVKVGAHQAHLLKTGLRATALGCADCHVVPTSIAHSNGTVDMTWGALASTGGLTPAPGNLGGDALTAWEASPTCANYCHGAGFAAAVKGSASTPSWTGTAATSTTCGSCHRAPPATSSHTSVTPSTDCGSCHAGYACTTANLGACTVNKATHLNGTVETPTLGCNACHGSASTNAAPPLDTTGASTGVKVGAHQAHLLKTTLRAAALDCSDCHTVPTSIPHASGTVDMTWGALARTGSLTPTPGNLGGAAQTTWEASPTCTNYCHGAGFAAAVKGSAATPSWTGTAAASTACGSCHKAPPATAEHASVTASTNCGTCHTGYSCTTANLGACTVNKGAHLNGAVDAPVLGCVSCHGSADNAAPPVDTAGGSSGVRVGAHQAHLVKANLRSVVLTCADCHTVPTSTSHASGTVDMAWSALARTGGLTPTPGNLGGAARTAWEASPTCANYCHGAGFSTASRGAGATPSWTGAAVATACGSCHKAPPATAEHASVTASTNCGTCHTGYSCTTANLGACTVNKAIHLNGTVETPNLSCSACHGSSTNAAPPVDTAGGSSGVRVGAHQAHLLKSNLRGAPLACADCHTVPTSTSHASGTVDMAWSALARTGGLTPTPGNLGGAARTAWEASPTCANYCHGAGFDAAHAGSGTSPSWTGAAVATACGSCHKAPPTSSAHASVTSSTSCGACHAGYACTSGDLGACTVNKATHLNGTLDAVSLGCTSCHGDSTQTATAAAPLHAAPPADTDGLQSGGTKIGAHQKHLTSTTYTSAGLACTTCHPSVGSYTASHPNGTSDVAFTAAPSANLRNGSWSAGAPGSCASTWCHGAVTNPNGGGASGGTLTTPTWTGTISGCTACHAVDMGSLTNMHRRKHTGYACSICHGSGYSSSSVNKATHLDGVRTIVTVSSGTGVRTFSNGNCTASCHGSENWYQ